MTRTKISRVIRFRRQSRREQRNRESEREKGREKYRAVIIYCRRHAAPNTTAFAPPPKSGTRNEVCNRAAPGVPSRKLREMRDLKLRVVARIRAPTNCLYVIGTLRYELKFIIYGYI